MLYCPKCGTQVSEHDRFCSGCSVRLIQDREEVVSETRPEEDINYVPRFIPTTILTPGEVLLFETRPFLWIMLAGPLTFTIFGGVFTFISGILTATMEMAFIGLLVPCLFILILGLLGILYKYLRWRYTVYAITNKRILNQSGIIGKDYVDCSLHNVQNVYLNISILGRLLKYGKIQISTAGEAWIELRWANVSQPRDRQRILNELIEKYRGH